MRREAASLAPSGLTLWIHVVTTEVVRDENATVPVAPIRCVRLRRASPYSNANGPLGGPLAIRVRQPLTPVPGDYNWVALAFDGPTSLFGYMGWIENRDVRPGVDIRETDYVDGFDVFQCRTPSALEPDTCPNAHGLDQYIHGQSITLPVG
jgi:hypothetical protein